MIKRSESLNLRGVIWLHIFPSQKQVNLNEGEGRKIASLQERLGGLESVKFGEGVFLAINKNIMDILDGFVDPLSLIG